MLYPHGDSLVISLTSMQHIIKGSPIGGVFLINASKNQLNDYNPIELENNLKLLEQEFQKGTQDMPCTHPPRTSDLRAFLEELRTVNAGVARELTSLESRLGNDDIG